MNLDLTPETLEAGYDFLRTMKPFSRWGLPPAASTKVTFHIAKSTRWYGQAYQYRDEERWGIEVSAGMVSHTTTFLAVLGHEMIHLRQIIGGRNTRNVAHNAEFRRLAAQVCRIHGLDLKAFWC
jgi:hypothetical protein